MWLRWEQAVGGGSGFAGSSGSGFAGSELVAVECSLSPLTIWLRWEQAVSAGSGFPGSSGFGFVGRGESGFAGSCRFGRTGSKLVVMDMASLVAQSLD
jgi:hypothetical protein